MNIVERNIGMNKGRPRLWLEKAVLTDNGFKVGDRIQVEATTGVLSILKDANGNRKVSGKGDRPIIDLTGKLIEEAFGQAVRVQIVSPQAGELIVTKAHK